MNKGNFIAGLALGMLAGIVTDRFLHSRKGRRLRRRVNHTMSDFKDDACEFIQQAKTKVSEMGEKVSEMGEEVISKVSDKVKKANNKAEETPEVREELKEELN